jgi:mycofactocin system creatininase family protein
MHLADARWPELGERSDVALVPLGSCEQHGPHLPFVTDAAVAEEVAGRAVLGLRARGVRAVATPVLAFGASGEHQHFPGTVDIGHEALFRVLVELGRSVTCWAGRVVFVNGHGGNLPTVRAATAHLRHEGRDVSWVSCEPPGADAHAGRTETSLMAAIAPDTVRLDAAQPGATDPIEVLLPRLLRSGVIAVSPNGVLGDPAGASAAEGEELLAGMVREALDAVLDGSRELDGRLRPAGVPA